MHFAWYTSSHCVDYNFNYNSKYSAMEKLNKPKKEKKKENIYYFFMYLNFIFYTANLNYNFKNSRSASIAQIFGIFVYKINGNRNAISLF